MLPLSTSPPDDLVRTVARLDAADPFYHLRTDVHGQVPLEALGLVGRDLCRRLDHGDVDLPHRHYGFHGPFCCGPVGVGRRPELLARRDLPREAPAVLAPDAGARLAAVSDDRVPITIGLLLVLDDDHEEDRLVRLEFRVPPFSRCRPARGR